VLFLRPGTACLHAVGTSVGVRYTGIDGRRDVDGIALDEARELAYRPSGPRAMGA